MPYLRMLSETSSLAYVAYTEGKAGQWPRIDQEAVFHNLARFSECRCFKAPKRRPQSRTSLEPGKRARQSDTRCIQSAGLRSSRHSPTPAQRLPSAKSSCLPYQDMKTLAGRMQHELKVKSR